MQPLNVYLAGTFLEKEVGNLIQEVVTQGEFLIKDFLFSYKECGYDKEFITDYYLPLGCSVLKFPPMTAIETKVNLSENTIISLYQHYKYLLDKQIIERLVIVTQISNYYYQTVADRLAKGKIFVTDKTNIIQQVANYKKQNNKKLSSGSKFKLNVNIKDEGPSIIDRARKAYQRDRYSLFLGAGVSMDAHLPSWSNLLDSLLRQEDKAPFKYINEENASAIEEVLGHSSIVTARYIFDGYQRSFYTDGESASSGLYGEARNKIISRIRETLYGQKKYRSNLIDSIASAIERRCPEQVITYNYDDLLETKLNNKIKYKSIIDANCDKSKFVPIYHVHGFIDRDENTPQMPVLSETEYHRLYSSMYNWANVVQLHALNTTTCFLLVFL